MKLRFTPRATQDLVDIADYIREGSPNASLRVRAAILDFLQDIVLFPEAGRRQTVEGVRKFVSRKYSYLIYYGLDQSPTRSLFSPSSTRLANESMKMHRHRTLS
jgi:toxin ParE1/3/4